MDDKEYLKLRSVAQHRQDEKPASEARYADASKQRLLRIITKKLHTIFIGDLSRFEKHMGHLWGHGKDESECTADQLVWREAWNLCRQDILDNGNHQRRAIEAEIEQYDVHWNRYKLELPVGGPVVSTVSQQKGKGT